MVCLDRSRSFSLGKRGGPTAHVHWVLVAGRREQPHCKRRQNAFPLLEFLTPAAVSSPSTLPITGAHRATARGDKHCDRPPGAPRAKSFDHHPTGCGRTNPSWDSRPDPAWLSALDEIAE